MQRTLGTTIVTILFSILAASPAHAASGVPPVRYVNANAWAPLEFTACGFEERGGMVAFSRERTDAVASEWAFSSSSCLTRSDVCPRTFAVCYQESGTIALVTPDGEIFGTFTGIGDAGYTFSWDVRFTGGTGTWQGARGRASVDGGRVFGGTITSSSQWTFIGLRA